jgi:hypothetical protein
LRLDTHFRSSVLTVSGTIITIHFLLHAVSAEFQTSRWEARHWRTKNKQSLLDSYRHNHPSSAKIWFNITSIEGIKDLKNSYEKYSKLVIMVLGVCFCIDFKVLWKFSKSDDLVRPAVCPSVCSSTWNNSAPNGQIF